MTAGIIGLVARSHHDLYLTHDPQVTFFKILYRRHTNFAEEYIPIPVKADFGSQFSCRIPAKGDMVGKIFFHTVLPEIPAIGDRLFAWAPDIGYALTQSVQLDIDDQAIDVRTGEDMLIRAELTQTQPKGWNRITGNVAELFSLSGEKPARSIYVPLDFWFMQSCSEYLPIVALTSSVVNLHFNLRRVQECCRWGPTHSVALQDVVQDFKTGDYIELENNGWGQVTKWDYLQQKLYYTPFALTTKSHNEKAIPTLIRNLRTGCHAATQNQPVQELLIKMQNQSLYQPKLSQSMLYVNYIYLDATERKLFLTRNHEYLIQQVQYAGHVGIDSKQQLKYALNLGFHHPCKYLTWVVQSSLMTAANQHFNYTSSLYPASGHSLMRQAELILDDKSRFGVRSGIYFNHVVPLARFSATPRPGINVYSFALHPVCPHPSGSLNMSQIQRATLMIETIPNHLTYSVRAYAVNYNVLRIGFGIGRLAFDANDKATPTPVVTTNVRSKSK